MTIRKELLDKLIKDYKNPEDLLGENGLVKQPKHCLSAMDAELTHELGCEKSDKSYPKMITGTMEHHRKRSSQSTARFSCRFCVTARRISSRRLLKSISADSMVLTI